ncbi:unnamed protein product [Amoebophrya sp. A120]|nr:unnamed protein product [Amoebophrya sp. A120]|eukprot:GSA120T00016981001.1
MFEQPRGRIRAAGRSCPTTSSLPSATTVKRTTTTTKGIITDRCDISDRSTPENSSEEEDGEDDGTRRPPASTPYRGPSNCTNIGGDTTRGKTDEEILAARIQMQKDKMIFRNVGPTTTSSKMEVLASSRAAAGATKFSSRRGKTTCGIDSAAEILKNQGGPATMPSSSGGMIFGCASTTSGAAGTTCVTSSSTSMVVTYSQMEQNLQNLRRQYDERVQRCVELREEADGNAKKAKKCEAVEAEFHQFLLKICLGKWKNRMTRYKHAEEIPVEELEQALAETHEKLEKLEKEMEVSEEENSCLRKAVEVLREDQDRVRTADEACERIQQTAQEQIKQIEEQCEERVKTLEQELQEEKDKNRQYKEESEARIRLLETGARECIENAWHDANKHAEGAAAQVALLEEKRQETVSEHDQRMQNMQQEVQRQAEEFSTRLREFEERNKQEKADLEVKHHEEIEQVQKKFEEKMQEKHAEHQAKLDQQEVVLVTAKEEFEQELTLVKEEHKEEVEKLENRVRKEIENLTELHEKKLADLEASHTEVVLFEKEKWSQEQEVLREKLDEAEEELIQVQQMKREEVKVLEKKFEEEKAALLEQHADLLEEKTLENEKSLHHLQHNALRQSEELASQKKLLEERFLKATEEQRKHEEEFLAKRILEAQTECNERVAKANQRIFDLEKNLCAEVCGDLAKTLKYMMETNLELSGGPRPEIAREDLLPDAVFQYLRLSKPGVRIHDRLLLEVKNATKKMFGGEVLAEGGNDQEEHQHLEGRNQTGDEHEPGPVDMNAKLVKSKESFLADNAGGRGDGKARSLQKNEHALAELQDGQETATRTEKEGYGREAVDLAGAAAVPAQTLSHHDETDDEATTTPMRITKQYLRKPRTESCGGGEEVEGHETDDPLLSVGGRDDVMTLAEEAVTKLFAKVMIHEDVLSCTNKKSSAGQKVNQNVLAQADLANTSNCSNHHPDSSLSDIEAVYSPASTIPNHTPVEEVADGHIAVGVGAGAGDAIAVDRPNEKEPKAGEEQHASEKTDLQADAVKHVVAEGSGGVVPTSRAKAKHKQVGASNTSGAAPTEAQPPSSVTSTILSSVWGLKSVLLAAPGGAGEGRKEAVKEGSCNLEATTSVGGAPNELAYSATGDKNVSDSQVQAPPVSEMSGLISTKSPGDSSSDVQILANEELPTTQKFVAFDLTKYAVEEALFDDLHGTKNGDDLSSTRNNRTDEMNSATQARQHHQGGRSTKPTTTTTSALDTLANWAEQQLDEESDHEQALVLHGEQMNSARKDGRTAQAEEAACAFSLTSPAETVFLAELGTDEMNRASAAVDDDFYLSSVNGSTRALRVNKNGKNVDENLARFGGENTTATSATISYETATLSSSSYRTVLNTALATMFTQPSKLLLTSSETKKTGATTASNSCTADASSCEESTFSNGGATVSSSRGILSRVVASSQIPVLELQRENEGEEPGENHFYPHSSCDEEQGTHAGDQTADELQLTRPSTRLVPSGEVDENSTSGQRHEQLSGTTAARLKAGHSAAPPTSSSCRLDYIVKMLHDGAAPAGSFGRRLFAPAPRPGSRSTVSSRGGLQDEQHFYPPTVSTELLAAAQKAFESVSQEWTELQNELQAGAAVLPHGWTFSHLYAAKGKRWWREDGGNRACAAAAKLKIESKPSKIVTSRKNYNKISSASPSEFFAALTHDTFLHPVMIAILCGHADLVCAFLWDHCGAEEVEMVSRLRDKHGNSVLHYGAFDHVFCSTQGNCQLQEKQPFSASTSFSLLQSTTSNHSDGAPGTTTSFLLRFLENMFPELVDIPNHDGVRVCSSSTRKTRSGSSASKSRSQKDKRSNRSAHAEQMETEETSSGASATQAALRTTRILQLGTAAFQNALRREQQGQAEGTSGEKNQQEQQLSKTITSKTSSAIESLSLLTDLTSTAAATAFDYVTSRLEASMGDTPAESTTAPAMNSSTGSGSSFDGSGSAIHRPTNVVQLSSTSAGEKSICEGPVFNTTMDHTYLDALAVKQNSALHAVLQLSVEESENTIFSSRATLHTFSTALERPAAQEDQRFVWVVLTCERLLILVKEKFGSTSCTDLQTSRSSFPPEHQLREDEENYPHESPSQFELQHALIYAEFSIGQELQSLFVFEDAPSAVLVRGYPRTNRRRNSTNSSADQGLHHTVDGDLLLDLENYYAPFAGVSPSVREDQPTPDIAVNLSAQNGSRKGRAGGPADPGSSVEKVMVNKQMQITPPDPLQTALESVVQQNPAASAFLVCRISSCASVLRNEGDDSASTTVQIADGMGVPTGTLAFFEKHEHAVRNSRGGVLASAIWIPYCPPEDLAEVSSHQGERGTRKQAEEHIGYRSAYNLVQHQCCPLQEELTRQFHEVAIRGSTTTSSAKNTAAVQKNKKFFTVSLCEAFDFQSNRWERKMLVFFNTTAATSKTTRNSRTTQEQDQQQLSGIFLRDFCENLVTECVKCASSGPRRRRNCYDKIKMGPCIAAPGRGLLAQQQGKQEAPRRVGHVGVDNMMQKKLHLQNMNKKNRKKKISNRASDLRDGHFYSDFLNYLSDAEEQQQQNLDDDHDVDVPARTAGGPLHHVNECEEEDRTRNAKSQTTFGDPTLVTPLSTPKLMSTCSSAISSEASTCVLVRSADLVDIENGVEAEKLEKTTHVKRKANYTAPSFANTPSTHDLPATKNSGVTKAASTNAMIVLLSMTHFGSTAGAPTSCARKINQAGPEHERDNQQVEMNEEPISTKPFEIITDLEAVFAEKESIAVLHWLANRRAAGEVQQGTSDPGEDDVDEDLSRLRDVVLKSSLSSTSDEELDQAGTREINQNHQKYLYMFQKGKQLPFAIRTTSSVFACNNSNRRSLVTAVRIAFKC